MDRSGQEEDWIPKKHHCICSEHFRKGKLVQIYDISNLVGLIHTRKACLNRFWCATSIDANLCHFTREPHRHPSHPDYDPSVFPKEYGKGGKADNGRFERFQKCREASYQSVMETTPKSSWQLVRNNMTTAIENAARVNAAEASDDTSDHIPELEVELGPTKKRETQTETKSLTEASQQTEVVTQEASIQVSSLSESLLHQNEQLRKQLLQRTGVATIEGNDKLTQTFTGLP